jgi:hypothetical protein
MGALVLAQNIVVLILLSAIILPPRTAVGALV